MDDGNQSLEVIDRPLTASVANRSSSTLPECYDHWDLPEVCHHDDLPEVFVPEYINNTRLGAVVPSVPRISPPLIPPKPEAASIRSCTIVEPPKIPFWRRHWIWIAILAFLVIAAIIGGTVSGVLLSRRREAESSRQDGVQDGAQDGASSSATNTATSSQPTASPTTGSSSSTPTTQIRSTSSVTSRQPQPTDGSSLPAAIILGAARRPGEPPEKDFPVAFLPGRECSFAQTGPAGENPCNRPWKLSGRNYTIHNCGGPLSLDVVSPRAGFYGQCPSSPEQAVSCKESGIVVTGAFKCTLEDS
ncbi:hypothetical protein QBC44DRAFT_370453 [Cladorrhinum sp. PSN332]|nr:hypothetical protein QBC44DRAFT_370453 [Cladorrhinum sp. PSN332]